MEKIVYGMLLSGLLALAPILGQAQDGAAAVEYREQVAETDADPKAVYHRALDWTEHHFKYAPKTAFRADPAKGEVRVTGASKVKTVTPSGQAQERAVQFDFTFRAVPTGYEYLVGNFHYAPDPAKPDETFTFDEYVAQLVAERTNARTRNDRRITAQTSSLASEVALSFRSYMNSRPAAGAVE